MGTDNLHNKRKARAIKDLERKRSYRDVYETCLIVCEGEKSEKKYLDGLCKELKLNSANIKVVGKGEDPSRIVAFGIEQYVGGSSDYDRLYCVFDKDEHHHFDNALKTIDSYNAKRKERNPVCPITSVPCFEYWLLLHFEDSSKPYVRAGKKSAADQLVNDLKKYIPDYSKGHNFIFENTKDYLGKAIERANNAKRRQKKSRYVNPSTNFHELIVYLQRVKAK